MSETGREFQKGQRFGPYVLVAEIGRGTFGAVWLADRPGELATTRCALKFPLGPELDLEAIRQEAQVWVRASGHPNVLPVIEGDIYDGQVVIVSEYAPEGTLKNWLQNNGGMAPVDEAVGMCTGILAGLEHLHSHNVVHRDLKPANILLQGQLPRISDFGLARVLCPNSSSQGVGGTPAYMSPEAWDGDRCVESDLWALGIVLHEMLLGRRPFNAPSKEQLRELIRTQQLPELPDFVPAAVRNVVTKALQKQKEQRFGSAAEMAAALNGRPVPRRAGRSGPPPSAAVWRAEQLEAQLGQQDGSPRDRAKAVRELGQLAADHIPAIRVLCRACDDPSPVVCEAVVKALRELLGARDDRSRLVRPEVLKQLRAADTPGARWCREQLGI